MKLRMLTLPVVGLALAAGAARGGNETTAAPAAAQSAISDLTSHEQAWAQACRRVAAIYREMAAPAESDSPQIREMKRQYALLADSEESAAVAAEKMAADHLRLLNEQAFRSSSLTRNINTGLFTR